MRRADSDSTGTTLLPSINVKSESQQLSAASMITNEMIAESDRRGGKGLPAVDLGKILSQNPFADLNQRSKLVSVDATKSNGSRPTSDGGLASNNAEFASTDSGRRSDLTQYFGIVTAIVTGGDRPAALINDRIYFEKDLVDSGWRVQAIHPDRVVIVPCEVD